MLNKTISKNLYESFGVADLVEKFKNEGKKEELAKLEKTLSKFILIKGLEDLSKEDRQKLADQEINDGSDLYKFFNKHIDNFSGKLKNYGHDFRNTIIAE